MAKGNPRKPARRKEPVRRDTPPSESEADKKPVKKDGMRETVEAIVMAFVLAFLFRTFEAEAFVIPTGSMAPTLYGRHKEVTCEQCGWFYAFGASDELDRDTGAYEPSNRIEFATCPNCRFEQNVRELPVFKGDRILVNKFPYEFGDPDRFDVIVFKYPDDPKTNYIKRLVGLPGEFLKIRQGDVYARRNDEEEWVILRKQDPYKQRLLQQLVYSHDHPETLLQQHGWPNRWAGMQFTNLSGDLAGWVDQPETWTEDAEKHRFAVDATTQQQPVWLRYRHFVPGVENWDDALNGRPPATRPVPELITDFCAYNAYTGARLPSVEYGLFWVGDLTISCEVNVEALAEGDDAAEILLELVEGGHWYRCRINPRSGEAKLFIVDRLLNPEAEEEQEIARAETDIQGTGSHRITFANVDDRLCLWVDGTLAELEKSGEGLQDQLKPGEYTGPTPNAPTRRDLLPVGIAVRGLKGTVGGLQIERDIYYRAEYERNTYGHGGYPQQEFRGSWGTLRGLVSDPERWYETYAEPDRQTGYSAVDGVVFPRLGEEEYFVLGDNSPRSQDSRLWPNTNGREQRHTVPGNNLVGKAFYVYWPHGVPFMNDGKGYPVWYHDAQKEYPSFRVPFYPYVSRMQRIR